MVLLLRDEFEFIYQRLNSMDDVELFNKRMSLPFDMLINVLARKITRKTIRDFYKIKSKSKALLKQWKEGKSIYELSVENDNFPPVLMATFILEASGTPKGAIRDMLKDNEGIKDKRVKKELAEACEKDFVYSPQSNEHQSKNGKSAEGGIGAWLDKFGIKYMTEYQNRDAEFHRRTPDFLLQKPLMFKGRNINWIESKASFGDDREIAKDYKKQLADYKKHFGPGAVVYWYGYIMDHGYDDVLVLTKEDFEVS